MHFFWDSLIEAIFYAVLSGMVLKSEIRLSPPLFPDSKSQWQ